MEKQGKEKKAVKFEKSVKFTKMPMKRSAKPPVMKEEGKKKKKKEIEEDFVRYGLGDLLGLVKDYEQI